MASERDLELLDDYLSNRLSESSRKEFEEKIESDPDLKQELQHQQAVVDGIREARVLELKTMLNGIPVTPFYGGQSAITIKVVSAILTVSLVSAGLYYFMFNESGGQENVIEDPEQVIAPPEEEIKPSADSSNRVIEPSEEEPVSKTTEPAITKPNSTTTSKTDNAILQRERELVAVISKTFVTSSTEVLVEQGGNSQNFHYAFRDKKLVLFGSFEKNKYQILEFITSKEHIFFLDYNQKYYLLDDQNNVPTPLTPISDPGLQKRLREFRTK